ncbi:MAG TPA: FAD-dependent oxidoreductase [Spirochaetota bacterium]|nr:FAD-dependent oxidoreductase [Spirochaetota bacterium]
MSIEHLLKPIKIGSLEIRNRMVFPPIDVQIHSEDREVAQRYTDFLTDLVKDGGVGLIISEFTSVANDRFWAPASRIDDDRFIPGFEKLVGSVKKHGARIFMQLAMLGGRAPTGRCVAPSAIGSPLYSGIPEELSRDEIEWLIGKWIDGAKRAKRIGFDGVEVHGGHSYLIGQFMSPHANHRDDEYGGDFEGRMRFPTEIIKSIKDACGKNFPVGIKFSAFEALPDGIRGAMAVDMAEWFEKAGVDYLHVSSSTYMLGGTPYPDVPPLFVPEGPLVGFAERIKKKVHVPVIAVAGIVTPEYAGSIVEEGKADLVAVGRGMFADTKWASKVSSGKAKEITPCIRCNMCHKKMIIDRAGEVECTVNPGLLKPAPRPAGRKKKVIVIGAGPAGLEASIMGAERGHDVLLYEKSSEIGGNVRLGCIPPFKRDLRRLLDHYDRKLEKSGVQYVPGHEVTAEEILEMKPDTVIFATGSKEFVPDIPGVTADSVTFARDYLGDESMQREGEGRTAVLGAGTVGCEISWYLSTLGRKVFIIDILPYGEWLKEEHPTNRLTLLEKLDEFGVQVLDGAEKISIEKDGSLVKLLRDKVEYGIQVDGIVLASGFRGAGALAQGVREMAPKTGLELFEIGDCVRVRDIHWAALEGYEVGVRI